MNTSTLSLDQRTREYLLDSLPEEAPVDRMLREETARRRDGNMQIAREQAVFMALLVRMLNARRTLEIGVFTGYSTLSVARALPADGCVVALDRDADVVAIARRYWREAGIEEKVDLRIGPALDTLQQLRNTMEGTFDFAFIDADKINYQAYFDHCVKLVRPGGLIAVDNVLWSGRVADPAETGEDTEALRAFNRHVREDRRVEHCIVPIADGLTLAHILPRTTEDG